MFDIVKFAEDTHLSVVFTGLNSIQLVGVGIFDDNGYTASEMFMVRQPDETDSQYNDRFKACIMRMYDKLRSAREEHVKNAQLAQQREEIEKMFRGL